MHMAHKLAHIELIKKTRENELEKKMDEWKEWETIKKQKERKKKSEGKY